MPDYKIVPGGVDAPEVDGLSPDQLLATIQTIGCREADVMCDGEYVYSIRSDADGAWTIFQR